MPRPGKTYPPVVAPRDAWVTEFIVAVQGDSNLRAGKFLQAIAMQQFADHGAAMTGQAAAIAWLGRQPGKR